MFEFLNNLREKRKQRVTSDAEAYRDLLTKAASGATCGSALV